MREKGLEVKTVGSTEGQSGPSTAPVPTAQTTPASTSTTPSSPPTSASTTPASLPTSAPPAESGPPQSVPGTGTSQAAQDVVPNCRFHMFFLTSSLNFGFASF